MDGSNFDVRSSASMNAAIPIGDVNSGVSRTNNDRRLDRDEVLPGMRIRELGKNTVL